MRYAFAGNKRISLNILKFLVGKGYKPLALFLKQPVEQSLITELRQLTGLEERFIFQGKEFKDKENVELFRKMDLDYIIGIHFPYIIPPEVLKIPKIGFLNLHPAYLPYNKGWHTPSWAILDHTPYGATLHFMSEALDGGDIIHQKKIKVEKDDTAHSIYEKVLSLEEDVFYEAFDDIVSLTPKRFPQRQQGTMHVKKDLKDQQLLDLENVMRVEELIDRLRALTTNDINEACYFVENDEKIAVQVKMVKLK